MGQFNQDSAIDRIEKVVAINGKIPTTVTLYTTGGDGLARKFIATHLIVRTTSVSALTTLPTFSIGTNATSYDDLVPSTSLVSTMNATDRSQIFKVADGAPVIADSTAIVLNITVGAAATTYLLAIDLFGYYE